MASVTPERGRPRSPERTEAILQACHDLVKEVGYDNLRMQDVAERSGTGLATIYRRWPTKQELVAAALALGETHYEVSGDPRADLRSLLMALAIEFGDQGDFLAGFMTAARECPEIEEAIRVHVIGRIREPISAYLDELVSIPADVNRFITDAILGVHILRGGLLGDVSEPEVIVDEVMATIDALAR